MAVTWKVTWRASLTLEKCTSTPFHIYDDSCELTASLVIISCQSRCQLHRFDTATVLFCTAINVNRKSYVLAYVVVICISVISVQCS